MPHDPDYLVAIKFFVAVFVSLFPMVNPFSTVPLYLSLTTRDTQAQREAQGRAACRTAAVIMLITLLIGGLVLEFFGISVSALRVAGGLIVAYLGFRMLFPPPAPAPDPNASANRGIIDYSFMPLAFPSLAGAGTMAVVMSWSTKVAALSHWERKLGGYVIVAVAIVCIAWIAWVVLRASTRISAWLGPQGLDAMARIMGLALVCIGVQFIADGIQSFPLESPARAASITQPRS